LKEIKRLFDKCLFACRLFSFKVQLLQFSSVWTIGRVPRIDAHGWKSKGLGFWENYFNLRLPESLGGPQFLCFIAFF
jgi:hypothetical protein